jgi:hypothetical protein
MRLRTKVLSDEERGGVKKAPPRSTNLQFV